MTTTSYSELAMAGLEAPELPLPSLVGHSALKRHRTVPAFPPTPDRPPIPTSLVRVTGDRGSSYTQFDHCTTKLPPIKAGKKQSKRWPHMAHCEN